MTLGRPPQNRDLIATTVRFPPELRDRLDAEAARRILGRGRLIELLLERALDELEAEELPS